MTKQNIQNIPINIIAFYIENIFVPMKRLQSKLGIRKERRDFHYPNKAMSQHSCYILFQTSYPDKYKFVLKNFGKVYKIRIQTVKNIV